MTMPVKLVRLDGSEPHGDKYALTVSPDEPYPSAILSSHVTYTLAGKLGGCLIYREAWWGKLVPR
jgi:hypothetical protein